MSCIGRVSKDVFFSICFSPLLNLGNTKLAGRLGMAREGIGEINKLPSQCVGGLFLVLMAARAPQRDSMLHSGSINNLTRRQQN